MSRFDAHCGVTNGSIRNCQLGHMGVNLIGFGEFLIENCEVYSSRFLNFRSDYGSFFHGTLIIRNCVWYPLPSDKRLRTIFIASNSGDHDFGYECGMPKTIVIDNLTVDDSELPEETAVAVFPDYDPDFAPGKPYPYGTPTDVTARITSHSGRVIRLCEKPEQYPALKGLEIRS